MLYQPRPQRQVATPCRQCRRHLARPTDNDREGFCSSTCYARHYRIHCLACEQPIVRTSGRQRLCPGKTCQKRFQALRKAAALGRYYPPGGAFYAVQIPAKSKACKDEKSDRPWRQVAGPQLDQEELRLAVLSAPTPTVIFKRNTPPLNIVGGHRFPDAPKLRGL
jgi:hypothetical protein